VRSDTKNRNAVPARVSGTGTASPCGALPPESAA
jgi:hypothetical protein